MAIKFNGLTKHGNLIFGGGQTLAFEDEHAEEYFKAMGWAEASSDEPVMTYPAGSVTIDPKTVFADGPNKGQPVLPDLAAAADQKANTEGQEG